MSGSPEQGRGRIAVLIAYTGDGGVEKMVNHLVGGLSDAGEAVDVLMLKSRGGHARELLEHPPPGVRVIRLDVATSLAALPALVRYLRAERPRALLAAKDRAGRVALLARRWAARRHDVNPRVVLRMGMHLSGSLEGKSWIERVARHLPVRWLYAWADAIVTVSDAVGDDLAAIGHLPRDRFVTIPNPVITDEIRRLADEPVNEKGGGELAPVVVAVGRLRPQKDFATLLRAMAVLRERWSETGDPRPAPRLMVLGDGPERGTLLTLRGALGLDEAVDFLGFHANPYPWIRAADALVLSSRFEGCPNVLAEAMGLGTPVVATDCPSGPRELLAGGRYGPLVPVGDADALADGLLQALRDPVSPATLRAAVADYTVAESSRRYRDVLLPC